ncbi:MAG: sugar phosphate nucleotidyltransferase [Polyangiaceae bacterium]
MKGVVLAGGLGTRLAPLTNGVNKHLLPVGDRPMIHYPLLSLRDAGVSDALLVSSATGVAALAASLGSGGQLGVGLHYCVQDRPAGIADALHCALRLLGPEPVCVILGDNVFDAPLTGALTQHRAQGGALVMLRRVPDPERYGVALVEGDRVVQIVEKPQGPSGDLAVTGIYLYDGSALDKLQTLRPSARGELEITDLNNAYVREGSLRHAMLGGRWVDAGTLESYHEANALFRP